MSMMEDEHHSSHKPQSAFEFTKRKRWADTIVTELLDIAILVFSHTGNILHCDAAVDDVIGYSEDDLLGKNVAGILHEQDVSVFLEAFNDSISVHSDLTSYVRIKPKHAASQKRCRLYEVRASPYYAPNNTDCVCVFAMVAPYPTFNSKDLDSFLPLKLENELLHDRLAELKRGDGHDTDESVSSDDRQQTPQSTSSYPDVIMRDHQTHIHGMGYHNRLSPDYTAQLQLPVAKPKPRSPPHRRESAKAKAANLRGAVQNAAAADVTEPNSLKRKRRSEASDGRVCTACGRNNSPEWRKGPQGPKTLCNACGLRWAKKAKRSHEPVEAV